MKDRLVGTFYVFYIVLFRPVLLLISCLADHLKNICSATLYYAYVLLVNVSGESFEYEKWRKVISKDITFVEVFAST